MNTRLSLKNIKRLKSSKKRAFTLIELMVVTAIISILIGLVFVSLTMVMQKAKRAKAKVQIKQIEKALVAYHDEYGEWPSSMTSYDTNPKENSLTEGIELEKRGALMLAGEPTDVGGVIFNDQGIRFLPTPNILMSRDGADSKLGYIDPWGHCYKYMCDFDDDGKLVVKYPNASASGLSTEEINGQGVGVWSRGPDGIDVMGGDGITSW